MLQRFGRNPLALAGLLLASSAHAALGLGKHLSLSGFGTASLVETDTTAAEYVREDQSRGTTRDFKFSDASGVDTNLGVQLDGRVTPWLSATVQGLLRRDYTGHYHPQLEWGFVKLQPLEGLSLRLGRTALPLYGISDFRNVGYANTWVRPPNEVYGLAFLSRLDGGDLSYSLDLGSTRLTASALYGQSFGPPTAVSPMKLDVRKVRGASLQWEGDWAMLRIGQVDGNVVLGPLAAISPLPLPETVRYTFRSASVQLTPGDAVVQAEYVQRRGDFSPEIINADAWYGMFGYRFGRFLPYAIYAGTRPQRAAYVHATEKQQTRSVGLRWDLRKNLDLKFQLDNVRTFGSRGISFVNPAPDFGRSAVTVGTIALDFVF